jgi:transposase
MEQKSKVIKRRKYDTSFKEEVLKMILNGRPVNEVAQSLGIGENLIYKWKSRSDKQQHVSATAAALSVSAEDHQALQKRIRELETERDILKKALAIFSRQT